MIKLYLNIVKVDRLPCFTISNLQEKIKEGENRFNSHTYKSYKHEIESKKPMEKLRQQQNRKHQVTAQELELDTKKLLMNMAQVNGKSGGGAGGNAAKTGRRVVDAATDVNTGPFACRKHPNGMSSTMFLNELDRRYYFEKPSTSSTQSKCNLHSRNLAKSLNELYTESSTSSAILPPPPPPSAVRVGVGGGLQLQTQTLPRPPQQFSDSPQEFPLTRSVSTTTDIYATQNVSFSGVSSTKTDYGNSNNNNRRRNVATNTRYNTDTETQTNGNSGGSSNNTKTQLQQQRNNIAHSKKTLPQQLQQQTQRHNNIYKTNYAATTTTATYASDDDLVGDSSNKHHHRQQRHLRATVNGHKADENDNDQVDNNDDDDDDNDEEQPQKLCGLKRTIRKTKDELFEEFCKRAGVRPKPKNIYYIENHEGENDDDEDDATTAGLGIDDNSTQQTTEIEEEMQCKPLRLNNVRTGNLHQRRMETPGKHLQHQQQQQQHPHGVDYRSMENNRIFGDGIDVVDIDEDVDENGFKKLTENEDHLYVIDGE
ncbi:putative uncharacterized protein DDB_G0285119 [Lucilia cuprina]|uniref:putative uncharacterized protein DDB_G0285119 n=1 Tax=Lucilia cuprina TaxID=7375 RepID=UPI001F06B54B|nr:putative uncharacterized protein DDB_G0285119 [Lucilia cuprina]